ncbi:UDP-N-acetylmuramate dehydrogenase [Alteromonas halophila]|uniref:UDP-N-acetylenolpyruvoylglucosamine reductase n=1 Tax=Alteromonas halophila TaxID=516698 RepID=A0A918JNJ0_9ALTE|nr:UDP-N-acetylmuramate dehydrogenase [Alteromonas halophila]GGW92413.1 UDP-N-acetylenolpyruvoylglucosamine reductase [Alteromonas halophila]
MPSLKSYHTFALDASCSTLTPFNSTDAFLDAYTRSDLNYLLGEGSNTVFLSDFDGQVLVNHITGMTHTETHKAHTLRVGAGENWHKLVSTCVENGWHGMENLALIPGSVGAAPIQNIGAYGCEVMQFIDRVEALEIESGRTLVLSNEECQFGYRDSVFKHALAGRCLITHVTFSLTRNGEPETSYGELAKLTRPTPSAIYDEVIRIRRQKLPTPSVLGNAGSFFKNPVITQTHFQALAQTSPDIPGYDVGNGQVKVPAAWLIDQCGYKGQELGGVRCHPTQPLVLTNTGAATGENVVAMARAIINDVSSAFAIPLEPEVRLVGEKGLIAL